jgi:hypothetical protein
LSISSASSSTVTSNRTYCYPALCTKETSLSSASCSLTKTDTLTIDIYNSVSISPISNVQDCPTTATNDMGVTTSLTYNSTNCVSLVGSGLNLESYISKAAYDPNAPQ